MESISRKTIRLPVALIVLVVVALLGPLGSDARAQSDDCANQDNLTLAYNCSYGPSYLIPGLTDLTSWDEPSHYRNILVGDLDGDKVDELVARGVGGLQVYRFDTARAQWTQLHVTDPILSDRDGWGQRKYYDTIRLGDLDGDGRAELVARSAGAAGIQVYGFNETPQESGTWTQLSKGPGPMADTTCFSSGGCWGSDGQRFQDPSLNTTSYYSTIQLTELGRQGSAPTMQLIGRGADGLELYRWNGTGWDQLEILPDLSDQSGWNLRVANANIVPWYDNVLLAAKSDGIRLYRYTPPAGAGDLGHWGRADACNPSTSPPSTYPQSIRPFRGLAQPTVMLRAADGVELWQWNATQCRWTEVVGGTLPFSDPAWQPAQYSATIQAADVDGDGQDELMGRGGDGMLTIRYNAGTQQWGQPTSQNVPALADDPWAKRQYYSTIVTARLDPASSAQSLLARGPTGIRTWRFDLGSSAWTRPQPYGNYPRLPADAFAALNRFLGIDVGTVRTVYTDPSRDLTANQLNGIQDQIAPTCTGIVSGSPPQYGSCSTPASAQPVSDADWTTVANQIIAELFWAQQVIDHFKTVGDIQTGLFLYQDATFPAIGDQLKLGQAEGIAAQVNYEGLFEGIFDILMALPIPGLEQAFEVTSGALGTAAAATPELDGRGPTKFDHEYAAVEGQIDKIQESAADAVVNQRAYVLGDYALLTTVGRLVDSQIWTLSQGAAVSSSRQAFTRWVYQAFLPTLWDHWAGIDPNQTGGLTGGVKLCLYGGTYDCTAPKKGMGMATYTTGPDGTEFDGLVPRQTPCSWSLWQKCRWTSLEDQGYGDTLKTLVGEVTRDCTYDPVAGKTWDYGSCGLGVQFAELFDEAIWGFRNIATCTYFRYTGFEGETDPLTCYYVQPQDYATGDARGIGTSAGVVDLAVTAPLRRPIDLRRSRVALGHLLHEGAGALELVKGRSGKHLQRRPVRLKRGARRHWGRFVTAPGTSPRVRGVLSVRGRRLIVRLHVDRARFRLPRRCERGTTHLGVHLTVHARRGRPVPVRAMAPWRCVRGKGGAVRRLTYRNTRALARVIGHRAPAPGGRTARVALRCLKGGLSRCVGAVKLRLRGTPATAIGRGRFSIRAGRVATARVPLSARARQELRGGGRLAVTATARTRHPSGALIDRRSLVIVTPGTDEPVK